MVDGYGNQFWYKDEKLLHRNDGPAEIWADGSQFWYKDGKLHREDGPAKIYPDGLQYWFKNNNLHRENGPAAILPDGIKRYYYCLNGIEYNLIPYIKKLTNFPPELDKHPTILADWLEENGYEQFAGLIREENDLRNY